MHLTLHLTTACNMNCSYCYAPPHDSEPMSEAIGRKALELGARIKSDSCGIVFFGGEPLLQKDLIFDLVAYGRHIERNRAGRFHFKVTTNGVLLDDEFLKFSVDNEILVAMSFDGVAQAHDRHRRFQDGSPTFNFLLPRLENLLAVRPYTSVLLVVNPDTARYLCESVSMLLDMGCKYLIVSPNYAGSWKESHFRTLRRELKQLAELYIEWTLAGRKFYLSPFEVKLSSHINQHCYRKERCELGRRQISVDPMGFLYPCVQFPKAGPKSSWCIGTVDGGYDDHKVQALRAKSEEEKAECKDCSIKDRCNNTCGCLNWQTMGDVDQVSPVLCRYERILIPIADYIGRKLYKKRDPLFLHKHYNAAYPVLSLLEDTYSELGN
jgi:uncharacterized protein